MLNAVIRFALRYRLLIVCISLATLIYGGYVTATLPIDVFPDLDRPRVVVMTECPGLAPEEVETIVTFPLEAAFLGATGVQAVRSQSVAGLSTITVEFDWGANIHVARQVVQERMASVAPDLGGFKPQMGPISSLLGQIMIVGIHRKQLPNGEPPTLEQQMELRGLADGVVRPRLLKIPGIAQVVVVGGARKQYQVLVDPNALVSYDVTLNEVEDALRKNNVNSSGGYAVQAGQERPIRIFGRLGPEPARVLADLRDIPVKSTPNRPILLRQVARVVDGPQPKRGDASVNGCLSVNLTITKQPHVDTRALTDQVKTVLAEIRTGLPADIEINTELFQMKRFIDTGVYNVAEALVLGAVLVLLVLFVFLLNFRTTFISLAAIPLSLAVTAIVFKLIGWLTNTPMSINVMTLGGIAVAMGELVDDAIVDVENIFRRLKQKVSSGQWAAGSQQWAVGSGQSAAESGQSAVGNKQHSSLPTDHCILQTIYEASVEIRGAIVFGTAMVILVFLPLFALSGIEGRLFTPLGIAYIVSILASLLISLTVTPVLSYYLLPQAKATHRAGDSPLLRLLKRGATLLIRLSMARAGFLLALSWLLVGVAIFALTQIGADFLPPFDEGSVQVNVSLPTGSSLEASNQASAIVDARLGKLRKSEDNPRGEILQFARRSGRAEMDEHVEPVSNTEYIVNINPESGRRREEVIQRLLTDLKAEVPGADIEVEQPLAHLISHMLSGVTAQIAIKVHGDDLDVLRRTAEQIKAVISSVDGVTPPVIEAQQLGDELHIRLRPEQLAFHGLDRAYVIDFLTTALKGTEVSQVLQGQRRFDLIVRLDEPYRSDYTNLARLRLQLPDRKGYVALGELAEITTGLGPNAVNRENARRRIVIRCNVQGRDLAGAVADIQNRVRTGVRLPEGYGVDFGGQFESQRRATLLIAGLAIASLAGMCLVLYMLYPSMRIVLQILNALPMAFIGGVLALVLTKQTLTVASMVGFISLGGIAARNGILLVSHYFHLMKHEGESFTPEMVLRGSLERLAPVLMTALTAGIALVPLVVVGQAPGREILYPVATVILGGLVTSTLCEYLLHPGLFWNYSGKDAARLTEQMQPELDLRPNPQV